ncbi:MAG TPA: ATP-binding protein [Thermoanaerobaculia bacterium]|nr:ATP-binding protein [Thermoanaerobaculia bacterium]
MSNPFVGPRAYDDGERLYGRGDEGARLYYLLLAERIVLLYSPSGAGKTSLLHAQLAPHLRDEGFRVFKKIRLNKVPPKPIVQSVNRYALATILSIEDELPRDERLSCEQVGSMPLRDYLSRMVERERREQKRLALMFDAFEEIFTLDPADDGAKRDFFVLLGDILKKLDVWAVFAMREEFIARLDEYEHLIPSRLKSRLRLSLLAREQAIEVMRRSAADQKVDFLAAPKLAEDLSRIRIHRPDELPERVPSRYVEPVVLQVVCRTLWRKMRRKKSEITEDDLAGLDVDNALADFYAGCVAEIVKDGMSERMIRDWFSQQLITDRGVRRQVMLEEDKGSVAGLPKAVVDVLVDQHHLLRSEERSGRTFYELAHDRLVEPVSHSNIIWARRFLTPLQSRAAEWSVRHDPHLLLRDVELVEAMRWCAEHPADVTAAETSYIEQSRVTLSELSRAAVEWEVSGRDPANLLRGGKLKFAQEIAKQKGGPLTPSEHAILKTSHAYRRLELRERVFRSLLGLVVPIVAAGFVVWATFSERRKQAELESARFQASVMATSEVQRSAQKLVLEKWADQPHLDSKALAEALDAQRRISTLATAASGPPRSRTVIQYFAKATDNPKLSEALRNELRFQEVVLIPSKVVQQTNAIWYGAEVPETDVKLIAYAVIRSGNELQTVQPLTREGIPPNYVNVGYNAAVADVTPLTVENIDTLPLRELKRWPAKYLGKYAAKVVEWDRVTRRGAVEHEGKNVPFRLDAGEADVAKGNTVEFLFYERADKLYAASLVLVVDSLAPVEGTDTTASQPESTTERR